jgi:uncharacterized membrane protein (DUF106 family)
MLTILALASIPTMGAVMAGIKITTPFYFFIAPAWLLWYLLLPIFTRRQVRTESLSRSIT